MYLHLEMGLSKEKIHPFFFCTDTLLISPNLNEIWVHFCFHSFSHTVLLVGFCCAVLFSQVSGCALFPLKHEVWIPSGIISVGHTACGSLPLLPWSLCLSLAGSMGRPAVLSHHARSEWGRMPFTSLLFSADLMDHGGYFVIQHLNPEKIFQGSLDRVAAFFFPSSSCCLDTNTELFFLQRNKLDVPGWLFFILSKEWISQRWISSDTSSAFMCWSENTDLSSWADLFHKRRKICLFLFEFSFKRIRSRIKSKWEKNRPF